MFILRVVEDQVRRPDAPRIHQHDPVHEGQVNLLPPPPPPLLVAVPHVPAEGQPLVPPPQLQQHPGNQQGGRPPRFVVAIRGEVQVEQPQLGADGTGW